MDSGGLVSRSEIMGSLNGEWIQSTTTIRTLSDLLPGTSTPEVRAVDTVGNEVFGTSAEFETPDMAPPTWNAGHLTAGEIQATSMKLSWTAATDDVGVQDYELTQDGEWLATVAGDVLELDVANLNPWTLYSFELRARDVHGNLSWESLQTSVQTVMRRPRCGESEASKPPGHPHSRHPFVAGGVGRRSHGGNRIDRRWRGAFGFERLRDRTTVTELSAWTDVDFGVVARDEASNTGAPP